MTLWAWRRRHSAIGSQHSAGLWAGRKWVGWFEQLIRFAPAGLSPPRCTSLATFPMASPDRRRDLYRTFPVARPRYLPPLDGKVALQPVSKNILSGMFHLRIGHGDGHAEGTGAAGAVVVWNGVARGSRTSFLRTGKKLKRPALTALRGELRGLLCRTGTSVAGAGTVLSHHDDRVLRRTG